MVARCMEVAGKIQTKNFFPDRIDPKTGKKHNIQMLVLHITDGSFISTKYHFENPKSYASSNYVLDTDGRWWECVKEKDGPWTNGKVIRPTRELIEGVNPNLYSITVEVVNSGQLPPWKQWSSWAKGCRDIMNRYELTIDDVVNHNEIHTGKSCPGPWFRRFYLQMLLRFV